MKKVLLFLGMAICGVAANAQDFKPVAGDVTTEFGLTGGINDTDFKLNDGAALLRFRYFNKEKVAYRLGFNVSSTNDKTNAFGTGANEGKKGTFTEKATKVLINLGIEKHFAGTDRLSPYVGGDILFGTGTTKTTADNTTAKGAAYADGVFNEVKGPGYVSIGLRGVVGADYYIAKRLYLGVEAGLGLVYEKEGKTKIKSTTAGTTTSTEFKSAGSSFNIKPSVITGVRVGFAF
ncbi:hypothetical protein [Pedobacter steynii]|uniref:Outer membrane protein beta-barrel domain-containing protein n=1 Tax=Pedobacter steynii TaxID=430522 RepID=A0A1D7QE09_9SPHI|nr:hypothetical protein [Pedobacter steynii]AOM76936.1 hypothetical protein BFS30_06990 [Pedobacter steynii]